jgi:D-alanyl-D-alanine carboxypeptidase/D-alanyl-D-alanine-endopeptidase (penicillin-binding protein 4)
VALVVLASACAARSEPAIPADVAAPAALAEPDELASTLDAIFNDERFARATWGVRIESLTDGRVIYTRNSNKLVVPASNMKLLTMAATAKRLGWDFQFETRLEAVGEVVDGTLHGDLVVVGGGDPSIDSVAFGPAPVFVAWADALHAAGIHRVTGRLVGDDNLFGDDGIGPGWAWDYLNDGYAAPSSALSYNENIAIIRIWPGATVGAAARVEVTPSGHGLTVSHTIVTGAAGSDLSVGQDRGLNSDDVRLSGSIPIDRATPLTRTASVHNPTAFFVGGLKAALIDRGVFVRGDAVDIDDVELPADATDRRVIATRRSQPLSSLAAYFLKSSQNFYGEMFLKTLGARLGRSGTTQAGRTVARQALTEFGIPEDAYVMYDGSGLSRYNYVSPDAIVTLLKAVWHDEALRGPFMAALPVGGQDGTLGSRMRNTPLAGRVQAKTGTISNVRSLSGFVDAPSGERFVFSIIANHFTAGSAAVDDVAEKALVEVVSRSPGVPRSRGPGVLRSRGPEVRRSRGPEVLRSRGPEVPRSGGPEVRRSRGPEVPKSCGPDVPESMEPRVFRPGESPQQFACAMRPARPDKRASPAPRATGRTTGRGQAQGAPTSS